MLHWSTLSALPRLRSYKEALAYYHLVEPIRGCKDELRPVGKRSQKWFNIQKQEDGSITLGYGTPHFNSENGQPYRSTILQYYQDGRVTIPTDLGCADRERIEAIAGIGLRRQHNQTWVWATAYVDGEEKTDWFTLSPHWSRKYENYNRVTLILRKQKNPLLVTPAPAIRHIANREGMKALKARMREFETYVSGIAKLADNRLPHMSVEELDEMLNEALPDLDRRSDYAPNATLLWTRWLPSSITAAELRERRERTFELAASGDAEKMYVAMCWLSRSAGSGWRGFTSYADFSEWYKKMLVNTYAEQVLIREEIIGGIVRDNYTPALSWY